jgi:hypothetical protein
MLDRARIAVVHKTLRKPLYDPTPRLKLSQQHHPTIGRDAPAIELPHYPAPPQALKLKLYLRTLCFHHSSSSSCQSSWSNLTYSMEWSLSVLLCEKSGLIPNLRLVYLSALLSFCTS